MCRDCITDWIGIKYLKRLQTVETHRSFIYSHDPLTLYIGANSAKRDIISPQEIPYTTVEGEIYCGKVYNVEILVCTTENNTSKVHSQNFPWSYLIWSRSSTSDKDSPKLAVKCMFFIRLLFMGKCFPSGSRHDLPQHVCWRPPSALKYRQHMEKWWEAVCVCMCVQNRLHRTWEEDHVPGPGGWSRVGSPATDCSTASVFNNRFLLFLGTRPFLTISWEERSSSRWGNECFGYLVTQKQWEKCKQSLDRSLDPSFHTWSLWLLWRDKLCNVCFSLDAFVTRSKAFTEARS